MLDSVQRPDNSHLYTIRTSICTINTQFCVAKKKVSNKREMISTRRFLFHYPNEEWFQNEFLTNIFDTMSRIDLKNHSVHQCKYYKKAESRKLATLRKELIIYDTVNLI